MQINLTSTCVFLCVQIFRAMALILPSKRLFQVRHAIDSRCVPCLFLITILHLAHNFRHRPPVSIIFSMTTGSICEPVISRVFRHVLIYSRGADTVVSSECLIRPRPPPPSDLICRARETPDRTRALLFYLYGSFAALSALWSVDSCTDRMCQALKMCREIYAFYWVRLTP